DWNSFGIAAIQESMSLLVAVLENGVAQLHRCLLSGYAAVLLSLVSVLRIPHPGISAIPNERGMKLPAASCGVSEN
ncbi:MAG: hypothetical protein AAB433_15005, partial [Nitrospirota bacterium]